MSEHNLKVAGFKPWQVYTFFFARNLIISFSLATLATSHKFGGDGLIYLEISSYFSFSMCNSFAFSLANFKLKIPNAASRIKMSPQNCKIRGFLDSTNFVPDIPNTKSGFKYQFLVSLTYLEQSVIIFMFIILTITISLKFLGVIPNRTDVKYTWQVGGSIHVTATPLLEISNITEDSIQVLLTAENEGE